MSADVELQQHCLDTRLPILLRANGRIVARLNLMEARGLMQRINPAIADVESKERLRAAANNYKLVEFQ